MPGARFALDGPKTLNGLILEELQDIPDAQVSLRFNDCVVEVVHVDDQGVRSARLFRLNKQKKPRIELANRRVQSLFIGKHGERYSLGFSR